MYIDIYLDIIQTSRSTTSSATTGSATICIHVCISAQMFVLIFIHFDPCSGSFWNSCSEFCKLVRSPTVAIEGAIDKNVVCIALD